LGGKEKITVPEKGEKGSTDDMCLNDLEGEIQNPNQITLNQEYETENLKNFFFVLESR
jgi:hypothetical protein